MGERRAVGYVRISKDRANETSTDAQAEHVRAYCASRGWALVDIVVEAGRSAWKSSRSERPGFRRARALLEAGAADAFVVWKIDRVARSTRDLLTFIEDELDARGAEFVSVSEQFDTSTPFGRAMLSVVGALAELESAQKSDRIRSWHDRRLTPSEEGQGAAPPPGPAPSATSSHDPTRSSSTRSRPRCCSRLPRRCSTVSRCGPASRGYESTGSPSHRRGSVAHSSRPRWRAPGSVAGVAQGSDRDAGTTAGTILSQEYHKPTPAPLGHQWLSYPLTWGGTIRAPRAPPGSSEFGHQCPPLRGHRCPRWGYGECRGPSRGPAGVGGRLTVC